MLRFSAMPAAQAFSPVAPERMDVVEIVDVVPAGDWSHLDLALRTGAGDILPLRIPRAAIADVLAQMADKVALALETSTAAPPARLTAPIGEWETVWRAGTATPTIECRTADGHGVAFGLAYDPITAVPQLQVAVDL